MYNLFFVPKKIKMCNLFLGGALVKDSEEEIFFIENYIFYTLKILNAQTPK
jgi:hypothetical protein